jgi:hypothetical protein
MGSVLELLTEGTKRRAWRMVLKLARGVVELIRWPCGRETRQLASRSTSTTQVRRPRIQGFLFCPARSLLEYGSSRNGRKVLFRFEGGHDVLRGSDAVADRNGKRMKERGPDVSRARGT